MCMVLRGQRLASTLYGAMTSWAPHCATGIRGFLLNRAMRTAPVLPVMGHMWGSRVIVPSG